MDLTDFENSFWKKQFIHDFFGRHEKISNQTVSVGNSDDIWVKYIEVVKSNAIVRISISFTWI